MSPTKYAIAICDDEKYWQNQILNCCKLLENDINFNLCSILNNLLDNALEYSAKNNFSTVWLNIYLEASVLLIDVVNNISAPIDISKFSSTTKADNINHGLGLAIVKETVHYYNGSLKYELSESQITAKVRLFTVE